MNGLLGHSSLHDSKANPEGWSICPYHKRPQFLLGTTMKYSKMNWGQPRLFEHTKPNFSSLNSNIFYWHFPVRIPIENHCKSKRTQNNFWAFSRKTCQMLKCYGDVAKPQHSVWKSLKMSHLNFGILAFFTNFSPIKTDLSGNTVWPQASGFQKLAKMDHFWHF